MRISDWISDVCSSDLVIVDPDGHATLIDLGAARPRGSAIATTVAGVLGFIPPERSTGPGDHRSDAWALGMTAIYALLGHPQGSMTRADLDDELRGRLAGTPEARRAIGLLSDRSEEHTSELQSLMRLPYAVFCLKKQKTIHQTPL